MSSKTYSAAQALDELFNLPSDPEDSDAEPDDGAVAELAVLQSIVEDGTQIRDNTVSLTEPQPADPDTMKDIPDILDNVYDAETEIDSESDSDGTEANADGDGWKKSVPDSLKNLPNFDNHASVNFDTNTSKTQKDYFLKIMTDNIWKTIIDETNRYAQQPRNKMRKGTRTTVTTRNWKDIDREELEAYVGMLIMMGIHELPELSLYWSSDAALGVPVISNVMVCKRFKKITETIHCNDNDTVLPRDDKNYDKLHKVRPLIDNINANIYPIYEPTKTLSIDESMIPFKGRSSLKQYMPMKPIKRGYKVWCIADSQTGYVIQCEIYTGKGTDTDESVGLGERVVLRLSKCAPNGSIIAFDNFFTSVRLVETLHKQQNYSVGTVRINRKGLPKFMKTKDKMKRGEHMFATKGTVGAVKWMDSKPVTVLSSAHDPSVITTVKRRDPN